MNASCSAASAAAAAAVHSPFEPAGGGQSRARRPKGKQTHGKATSRTSQEKIAYGLFLLSKRFHRNALLTKSTREGPLQSHVPAALAAGAQLEKSFSGSVTTAAVAAAAREADMPTGKKERGPKLPESSVHEESATKFLVYGSFLPPGERT